MTLATPEEQHLALRRIVGGALEVLKQKQEARERGLQLMREVIRGSALTIRAIHRNEYQEARALLGETQGKLREATATLREHPDIYHAGFLQDAQKEYAEACLTLAFITSGMVPDPEALEVDLAPYLNGLAEAASELRRYILDALRRDSAERTEALLDLMDEVYSLLVTVDYPDAITGGLRRTTDMVRGCWSGPGAT